VILISKSEVYSTVSGLNILKITCPSKIINVISTNFAQINRKWWKIEYKNQNE
jgi:hypothetical protein